RPLEDMRSRGRELLQEHPRALVGAVLGPHHADDAQLLDGRRSPEDVDEPPPLVARETVLGRDLRADRRRHPDEPAAAPPRPTHACTERKSRSPSSPTVSASTACSGCGMSPTTFRPALHTPAMLASEPFGLASAVG